MNKFLTKSDITMENRNTPPAGAPGAGTYRHYKGPLYRVLGTAQHSETDEWMVIYQALYGEKGFWVRPLSLWLEPLDSSAQEARFELVSPSDVTLTQLTEQTSHK